MRIFVTKEFGRFARKQKISDDRLCEAVDRAEEGTIDADLGGGVIKQRVARLGQGLRSGFRTLIAYRHGKRAVFIHGFAKKERDNIDDDDLKRLRKLAALFLSWREQKVGAMIDKKAWREVECDGEE